MEDSEIVALFLARDVAAIRELEQKYGAYCMRIALNILKNEQDAEESVNDMLLKIWNAIPPFTPANLKAYAAKTVRNAALDLYRGNTAEKRGGGEIEAVLSELEACLPSRSTPEEEYSAAELGASINRFLQSLDARERTVFMQRYYFSEETASIAEKCGLKPANVRLILSRTRAKLKKHLKSEGFL